jgi:hypothetical protein
MKGRNIEPDSANIRAIRPDRDRRLIVTWKNGLESIVDLSGLIAEYHGLRSLGLDEALFRSVGTGEWGWCAHWTDELEISSDTLRRLALEQGRAWLREWRTSRALAQDQAARAVGVSPRMWRYYEAGDHLLPKTVRLACIGYDAQDRAA